MAKEQFREWNPKGNIKVTYKSADGSIKIWEANPTALLSTIMGITRAYMAKGIKLTNRQLYYQLVSTNTIPNALKIYKKISDFLTDARYGGYIDWEAIEDRGRKPDMHAQWDNVKSLIESAVSSYRKPRWDGQEYYIELMCEKQALENVFQPVSNKYHIYFGYNKGYSSASTMYDMAKRVKEAIEKGKMAIVFYWGDHDASGLDMLRDIKKRTIEFLTQGEQPLDDVIVYDRFDVIPLGLNMEQIERYHPPPNPAKTSDPRAAKYIEEFGNISWELDALDPTDLRAMTETAILEYLDIEIYNQIVAEEKEEIKKLREFGDSLVNGDEPEEGTD